MHGREGEERKRRRGMLPVHAPGTLAAATAPSSPPQRPLVHHPGSNGNAHHHSPDSFLKDGRKIRVGDSALFQSGDSPPFIGIIRWFTSSNEGYIKLCVNWLYRPSDVKLSKGVLLEAAPNEVFYSFHKDEISAESLLHPCRVAFLRKGVELPPGVSSFVCRRVYDIANKCLWWLTDEDYINDRQEEVDKLLDRTQLEMQTVVQSGGRSPKQLNGPTSAQQLKAGSDSLQNSGSSVPSQGKAKKREKVDQSLDSVRRDRTPKTDDGESGNFRLDSTIKAEISKITDRGGLVDAEGVDKLLNLMQLDRADKKIDISARVLLADVIASTDRFDCLNRFVQLKGVVVLHDWLQEVHKGKTGDGNSPKEGDKSVEELLLALLRALDKLPVNLYALQTSNIGKSVNHLRTHKSSEIQKKARHLVDTWKKRVDAEMSKTNDTKSASSLTWSGKPGLSDIPHGTNKRTASSEAGLKNSVNQPSLCKSLPAKPGHGDIKSSPLMSGSTKALSTCPPSAAICSKDVQCKPTATSGTAEMPLAATKEEKSSGSSQSQNNSQSCSSDHAKNVVTSLKEDARSTTMGSASSGKTSGGTSRHRKSNNGFMGTGGIGIHKETTFGKSLSYQNRSISQSGASGERSSDLLAGDTGNSQRLIVRLPNPGRSPARSVTGGSVEEPSVIGSRASSPISSEKHDQGDRKPKVKGDAWRANSAADVNVESMHANCVKEEAGLDEAARSPCASDEEQRNMLDKGKVEDAPKDSCSSFIDEKSHVQAESKPENLHDPSFSSINALVESCVQYNEDEPKASLSSGDDLGMNLLASVATGEMPKAEPVSPAASPLRKSPACDEKNSLISDTKPRASLDNIAGKGSINYDNMKGTEIDNHSSSVSTFVVKEELKQSGAKTMADLSDNGKERVNSLKVKSPGEDTDIHMKFEKKAKEAVDAGESILTSLEDKKEASHESDRNNRLLGKKRAVGEISDSLVNGKHKFSTPSDESKPQDCALGKIAESSTPTSNVVSGIGGDSFIASSGKIIQKKTDEESQSCSPLDMDVDKSDKVNERSTAASPIEKHLDPTGAESSQSKNGEHTAPVHVLQSTMNAIDQRNECGDGVSAGSAVCDESPSFPMRELGHGESSMNIKSSVIKADEAVNMESCEAASKHNLTGPDNSAKCVFDLNEGIAGDEGNIAETNAVAPLGSSSAVRLPSFLPFTVSPISSLSPVAVTVAAPAKGPFVPPENLLKSKSELGWKGSAATSAFRPAEPRKVLEMPFNAPDISSDFAVLKQNCHPLDIDLNVPDERVLQEMPSQSPSPEVGSGSVILDSLDAQGRSSRGLDLDLNRADEDTECGQFLASTSQRLEFPNLLGRPPFGRFRNGEATSFREFDLNNGPGLDEASVEPVTRDQHTSKSVSPYIPSMVGLRMNNTDLGSLQPWFHAAPAPGNSFPAVAIPPFLPDRGDHSYPLVASAGDQRYGSAAGTGSFGSDLFRGPVLSSSPAMAFPPYANLPFGPGFSLPSTSFSGMPPAYMDSSSIGGLGFPPVPSQLAGPANAASAAYVRPILISLPESSASGGGSESNRKWDRQALDLNAGPGGTDIEGRDERFSSLRQHFVASSQAFADEQARIFQIAGGGMKRKEPEGGWDAERFSYRQPSRQ